MGNGKNLFQKQTTINGSKIKHLQFCEISEGHGSIYGTLENGNKFKLHITELMKMVDEFDFEVYPGPGNVLDHWLKIDWDSTNKLKKEKDFSFKSSSNAFTKNHSIPNKVNYIIREGEGTNTKFKPIRKGPYYSGTLVDKIISPSDVKSMYRPGE